MNTKKVNLKSNINQSIFKIISESAQEINQSVYIVGGFVRDLLLGINSPKDIDFVTEGSGIKLAETVHKNLNTKSKISVFKRFGTAMIRHEDIELEFVGARKESYSEDSRKPFVESGTIEDDQKRRDFTINALAISLNPDNYGELVDPFNGINDLENKILKTPLEPEITYSDDPLRMMRAIRFASQLNFTIEQSSLDAISSQKERIQIVSKERITTELNKILLSKKPSIGLKLLDDVGLMKYIIPELVKLKGVEELEGQSHKDNFYHTLEVVDNISAHTDNLWLRWSALLHDIGKAPTKKFVKNIGWTFHTHEYVGSKMAKTIFKRLRLPLGNDLKYVQKIVRLSSRPISLITENVSDSALRRLLFEAGNDLDDLITLCKADITTKNTTKQKKFKQNFEKVELKIKELEERDRIRNFKPPITGEEVMNTFNLTPGKTVGKIKDSIKNAILDGIIPNEKESAKKFMLDLGKQLNLSPKK
ncbi:MAG: HD domain-containing protein [Flavobacteriales bacterium]|nr:HD domain-containing protein [Flavobacteriales bacterium]